MAVRQGLKQIPRRRPSVQRAWNAEWSVHMTRHDSIRTVWVYITDSHCSLATDSNSKSKQIYKMKNPGNIYLQVKTYSPSTVELLSEVWPYPSLSPFSLKEGDHDQRVHRLRLSVIHFCCSQHVSGHKNVSKEKQKQNSPKEAKLSFSNGQKTRKTNNEMDSRREKNVKDIFLMWVHQIIHS